MTDNGKAWLSETISSFFDPIKRMDICEWMSENFHLPPDTSEPGLYNPVRAPYQADILKAASPQASNVRVIVLCFGSQMGKTLTELGIMTYYIAQYPQPQGFVFSNKEQVKSFVKTKFNPILSTNPDIKSKLGIGQRSTGDTLTEKIYPGGFLKFCSGNSEEDTRSWSAAIITMDEVDTYVKDLGGNGHPVELFANRKNTFEDRSKFIISSTPANTESIILDKLAQSTYRKYFVRCPYCKEYLTFEWEYMRMEKDSTGKIVLDAWMECPHCEAKIRNSDKARMLGPEFGAEWRPTNPEAPAEAEGFFLPSFYAPVGWISFKSIAQSFVSADTANLEMRITRLTAFYNTVLCRQYLEVVEMPQVKTLKQRGADSLYIRGQVPNWVYVITTAADVQGNRLEISVIGWGRKMRNHTIDHIIIPLKEGEDMEDADSSVWQEYEDRILNGLWEREDRCMLTSRANAMDCGFIPQTVYNANRRYLKNNENVLFYPVKGDTKHTTDTVIPSAKKFRSKEPGDPPLVHYVVPVDAIKSVVFQALLKEDNEEHDTYGYSSFPRDFSDEFYDQLVSERKIIEQKTGKPKWVKTRDRNETLDTRVYNYALAYLTQIDSWNDDDWDSINEILIQNRDLDYVEEARRYMKAKRQARVVSSGIV